MRDKMIPVVFTPDEGYIIPTCVSILSMLRTKEKNTDYKFYIVISDKFDKKYLAFLERIKKIEEEFVYQILTFCSDLFDRQKITTEHLTTSAYYRLALADIISDYDKCMYHDGDVLVNTDLQEMYRVNLDNSYVAGVKAVARHQETKENKILQTKWGFPSFDNYIVSSNLIMNLYKIRKDGMMEEFKAQMKKGFPAEDQDVINLCCYGKISFLPLKFNMFNRYLYNNMLEKVKNRVFALEEISEARQSPAIVHFAGKNVKPWNNLRTAYGEQWWRYARKILTDSEYAQWRQRAGEITEKRDWSYLKKVLAGCSSILVFGCGKAGKEVMDALILWGYSVKGFIDNDVDKQGNQYEGFNIMDAEQALQDFQGAVIVNSIQTRLGEIRKQLISMGVTSDRIIDYLQKNENYFLALAPEWRAYEFNDQCVKKYGWSGTGT